jgi:hypothetical protein
VVSRLTFAEILRSLEDVANIYSPRFVVWMYEKFEFIITRNSFTREGREIYPLMVPFRELSLAFRRLYPNIESREEVSRMERERSGINS